MYIAFVSLPYNHFKKMMGGVPKNTTSKLCMGFISLILLMPCNLDAHQQGKGDMEIQQSELRQNSLEIGKKHPIKVLYTNYRHEKEWRTIIPIDCFWGHTEYHTQDQWLMRVWDCDKNAERIYAMQDIEKWDYEKPL